jgi:2'-5' RNA ligase
MTREPAEQDVNAVARLETAVVIVVNVRELQTIYRDSYPAFAELGIPLHVTLLYPFATTGELGSALPLLREVLAYHEQFAFELAEFRTFPRTVWLAPEPAAPFVALTRAIEAAFPQYPHWEGQFEDVIPHLTLADGLEENELEPTLRRLRTLVEPLLPIKLAANEATVLAEQQGGHWVAAARLPLSARAEDV